MPGRARQRYIREWIEKEREAGETPLDYIANRLSNGEFLQDISAEIAKATQVEVPQHALRRFLIDEFGKEDVLARFEEARRDAADVHVADGWTILNEAPEIREALDKAHRKSEYKKWLSTVGNRERYGAPSAANVNVNLNLASLHLEALRQRTVRAEVVAPGTVPSLLGDGGLSDSPNDEADYATEEAAHRIADDSAQPDEAEQQHDDDRHEEGKH